MPIKGDLPEKDYFLSILYHGCTDIPMSMSP